MLETSCVTMSLLNSCSRQVGHTADCFRCFTRYFLKKKERLMSLVRLSEYDKICKAITRIPKIYILYLSFSRGDPWGRDDVHVLLDNYKCCQMYKDNGQLQKSTHRLSSTSIRNHPRKMQMTISDICSAMFVCFHTTVNKPVVIPGYANFFNESLFPLTCANRPQRLIVVEYNVCIGK